MSATKPSAFNILFVCIAITLLGGCVSPLLSPTAEAVQQNASMQRHGRFSVRYQQNGQPQSLQGQFSFSDGPQGTVVELRSPLGQALALLIMKPTGVELELPNTAPSHADNVDALMLSTLGFALPVEGLRDWLLARPAPTRPAMLAYSKEEARISHIEQDGWTIEYPLWHDAPNGPVPRRIDLRCNVPNPLELRLVLDDPVTH